MEQPNLKVPVHKVKSLEDNKIRTLHRNMLLPLGVKFIPEESEESDQDSEEVLRCGYEFFRCQSQPLKCTNLNHLRLSSMSCGGVLDIQ